MFPELMEASLASEGRIKVVLTVTDPDLTPQGGLVSARGGLRDEAGLLQREVGRVNSAMLARHLPPPSAPGLEDGMTKRGVVCGPPGMFESVQAALGGMASLGYRTENIVNLDELSD